MDALFQRGLGMQFDSPEGRTRYFAQARENPASVRLGAAFSHAESTNLGVWGDQRALRDDCAQIMAFEIAHLAKRRGIELTGPISKDDVLKTKAFDLAFTTARHGPDALMQNIVDGLGIRGRLGRHEKAAPDSPQLSRESAHQAVFDEMAKLRLLPI